MTIDCLTLEVVAVAKEVAGNTGADAEVGSVTGGGVVDAASSSRSHGEASRLHSEKLIYMHSL